MRENFACRLVSFAAVTQQLITLILSKGLREMSENPNGILTVFKFRLMKRRTGVPSTAIDQIYPHWE